MQAHHMTYVDQMRPVGAHEALTELTFQFVQCRVMQRAPAIAQMQLDVVVGARRTEDVFLADQLNVPTSPHDQCGRIVSRRIAPNAG